MRSVRALLDGILDYAGLFQPAKLDLADAVENYARYREHPHGWLLGRLVLPWPMAAEAGRAARVTLVGRGENLTVEQLGPNVEWLEVAGSLAGPAPRFTFHELDWRKDFAAAMAGIPPGRGVKLRTGGASPDMVPPAAIVAEFLWQAAHRRLPIKFAAGLQRPFPEGGEHGFLNVFAAAFAAYEFAASVDAIDSILNEVTVRFTDEAFHAGRYVFPIGTLRALRTSSVLSFGTSDFLATVEQLESLRILGA